MGKCKCDCMPFIDRPETCRISEGQSKIGLKGYRKTHHPDVQRKNLTNSSFIEKQSKQLKKQEPKLLIKSFTEELIFREL